MDRGEHLGTACVDGITVRYLPTPLPAFTPRGVLSFLARFPECARQWARALAAFRPSILHVHCFGPNGIYALATSLIARRPLIVSSHGETFTDENDVFSHSRLLRWGLRTSFRRAGAVTGCSQTVLNDLRARFGLLAGVVVPNGVAVGSELPSVSAPREKLVFAVGRMVEVKGFDLLLAAYAAADLPADTRLVIGGDGPQRPRLIAQARQLGIEDRVSFPGRLSGDEVADWMSRAQVVAVPSRHEAFGIVLLEGWRSGAALLATCHDGPGTIVHDGVDGVLIDPDDTPAFASKLRSLLSSEETRHRLAHAGRARLTAFTWSAVVDSYDALYRDLIPSGRRS